MESKGDIKGLLEESFVGPVTFKVGDAKVRISPQALTTGPLKDTLLGTLFTSAASSFAGKQEIVLEDGDAYYLEILLKYGATGDALGSVPWKDPKFDMNELCRWARYYGILDLVGKLGCDVISEDSSSDAIGYLIKRIPSMSLPLTFIVFGTEFSYGLSKQVLADHVSDTLEIFPQVTMGIEQSGVIPSTSYTMDLKKQFTRIEDSGMAFTFVVEKRAEMTVKVMDVFKEDEELKKIAVKRFESYDHALVVYQILKHLVKLPEQDRNQVMPYSYYGGGMAFNRETATLSASLALLERLRPESKASVPVPPGPELPLPGLSLQPQFLPPSAFPSQTQSFGPTIPTFSQF